MKHLLTLLTLVAAGCGTRPIVLAPITLPPIHIEITGSGNAEKSWANIMAEKFLMQALGPESLAFQIGIGCESYRRQAGRWPRTKDEVAAGLAIDKLSSDRLADLQQITLQEEGDSLVADFVSSGKPPMQGQIKIHPPKTDATNRSAPAPGSGT